MKKKEMRTAGNTTKKKKVLHLASKKARKVPRRARLKKEIFKKFKE